MIRAACPSKHPGEWTAAHREIDNSGGARDGWIYIITTEKGGCLPVAIRT
ncbi:MAG: hypothetical protein R3C26_23785 [Calditrichia bacterium]